MADYEDLPRAPMREINIAFDVDGTLRCNGGKKEHAAGIQSVCDEFCQEANEDQVVTFKLLSKLKNTRMHVWSGGGADYAWQFAQKFNLPVTQARCFSKFDAPAMDIAFDDIQETDLATINLIVREK